MTSSPPASTAPAQQQPPSSSSSFKIGIVVFLCIGCVVLFGQSLSFSSSSSISSTTATSTHAVTSADEMTNPLAGHKPSVVGDASSNSHKDNINVASSSSSSSSASPETQNAATSSSSSSSSGGGTRTKQSSSSKAAAVSRYHGHNIDRESLLTDIASEGLDPNNLFSPKCHLSTENILDGGCKMNPWYKPGRSGDTARVAEFQCQQRQSERSLLRLNELLTFRDDAGMRRAKRSAFFLTKQQIAERLNQQQRAVNKSSSLHVQSNSGSSTSSSSSASSVKSTAAALLNFKRYTSWMFDKWYDWKAKLKCSTSSSSGAATTTTAGSDSGAGGGDADANDGQMRGYHDPVTKLYKLENFCLKPMGALSGYKPQMAKFHGVNEAHLANMRSNGDGEPGMRAFLKRIDTLKEKPSCFVEGRDRRRGGRGKFIIMPISKHQGNVIHVLHKSGSMLRVVQEAFGRRGNLSSSSSSTSLNASSASGGRNGEGEDDDHEKSDDDVFDDVTIIYVVTKLGFSYTSSPEVNERINTHKFFYDAIPGGKRASWFSVFSDAVPDVIEAWQGKLVRGDDGNNGGGGDLHPIDFNLLRTPLCFRGPAYVWQNAISHVSVIRSMMASDDDPAKRTSFQLFGHRSLRDAATLNLLNDKLRSCHPTSASTSSASSRRLPKRRLRARRKHPHVLFVVRSGNRRFMLQPHIINVMADYVHNVLKGTFEVLEHIALDFDEVIERFSNADILVGMTGAGLLWNMVMPPGAVVIEFSIFGYRCSSKRVGAGINVNSVCDFGGGAAMAQQWHIAMTSMYLPLYRPRVFKDENPHPHLVSEYKINWRSGGKADLTVGGTTVRWALDRAKCILEHGHFDPGLAVQKVPPQCQFNKKILDQVTAADVADEKGENLAAFVQMQLPPLLKKDLNLVSPSSSSKSRATSAAVGSFKHDDDDVSLARMRMMVSEKHRRELAAVVKMFQDPALRVSPKDFGGGDWIRMQILVPCRATAAPNHLLAEVEAWRMIFRTVYRVLVGEMHAGAEFCRRKLGKTIGQPLGTSSSTNALNISGNGHNNNACHGIDLCTFEKEGDCYGPASSSSSSSKPARPFHLIIMSSRSSTLSASYSSPREQQEEEELAVRQEELLKNHVAPNGMGVVVTFDHATDKVMVHRTQPPSPSPSPSPG